MGMENWVWQRRPRLSYRDDPNSTIVVDDDDMCVQLDDDQSVTHLLLETCRRSPILHEDTLVVGKGSLKSLARQEFWHHESFQN